MIKAWEMKDLYRPTEDRPAGSWANRWVLGPDGQPAVAAVIELSGTNDQTLARLLAGNRLVRQWAAAAEAYEDAARRAAEEEPPQTLTTVDNEGTPTTVPNPGHAEWLAAQQTLAAADAALLHLVQTRAGTLAADAGTGGTEAPFSLQPALDQLEGVSLDPRSQTADWNGSAWVVRSATAEELAPMDALAPRYLPPRDFFTLFTPAELGGIRAAAAGGDVVAFSVYTDAAAARFIDRRDPATAAGLAALVERNLLTPARVPLILAGAPA